MLPESIVANSTNQLTISFGVSESGYAMLSYGASSSGTSGASGATGTSGSSGSSGSSGTSAGSASRNVTTFIATSGQTTFTISSGYTVGLVDVFVNGVRYSPTDFTATNGTTVVLGVSSDVDDVVDIIHYVSSMTAIAGEGTTGTIPKYTASGTIGNSIITDNGTNATVNGSLTVTGNLTAQQFIVSSSVTHLTTSFSSGSTKFGDSSDDNHNFTGSLIVSGSANPLRVGSNLLFVSSSGFIGINNVSPTVALDVTGAGKFSGSVQANSTFTLIGGNATNNTENAIAQLYDANINLMGKIVGYRGANGAEGNLRIYTNNTTPTLAMTITSAGNVGIGTSSPVVAGGSFTGLDIRGSGGGSLVFGSTSTLMAYVYADSTALSLQTTSTRPVVFAPGGDERMRITSGGQLCLGATNNFGSGLLCLQGITSTYNIIAIKDTYTGAFTDNWYAYFLNDSNSRAGGIQHTASTTVSFVTSSDYRLKEDFKQIKGLETLLKIKTYDFKFKEEEFRMDGVIAHELAEVLPYAVSGVKDGKEMQGVDYSKLVPVLIKSVQELSAELTSAKQEIELLKLK
jgi:hypothetical protein